MNLKQQRAAALKAAQDLIASVKAAGREFTTAETGQLKGYRDQITDLDARIKSDELMGAFQMGAGERHGQGDVKEGRLDFGHLTDAAVAGMKAYSGTANPLQKALVPAGETIVPIPLVNTDPIPGAVALETPPRLIDVLPAAIRPAAVYDVLRQIVVADSGGAGVVAPGATKPTKRLGLRKDQDRLRVVAVLSEPVDKYTLEDVSNLRTWVAAELGDAIQTELEQQVLVGNGTGDNFTGLANVSGIQTQAFATDRVTTIAAGLAKLSNIGVAPSFIALSAADALALQTTRNASGAFDLGGAIDPAASKAWGTTFVVVPGLAAGDGYVVGGGSVMVSTDGNGVKVDWGTPGDTFTRNQLVARVEGRFNLDVLKAHGIVRLDLAA